MEFYKEIEPIRKLNTKGCCFLCLKSDNTGKTEEGEANQIFQSISIRQLLRHLQIPTAQSLDIGSLVGQDYKKEEIQVDLCENCGHAISRFSDLFQKLEKIKLEINYFLEKVHKGISQSAKSPELVQNYSKRMTSDLETLSQLAFVDNLRKQVAKESSRKLNVPRPQLMLTRVNCKPIKKENIDATCAVNDLVISGITRENCKPEINEETGEGNGVEFDGSSFLDEISSPPSPNSTADYEEDLKLENSSTSRFEEQNPPQPLFKLKLATERRSNYFTKDSPTGFYNCKKCDKTSKTPKTIADHYKSVHLKLRHKCVICNVSVFTKLSNLTKHKKSCPQKLGKQIAKEKDPRFKFICKLCGKRYETSKKLVDHTRWVHINLNRFQCDLCDKKYTTKATLRSHQAAIHQSKKFYCKICNKIYRYAHSLKTHERKCGAKGKIKMEPTECE